MVKVAFIMLYYEGMTARIGLFADLHSNLEAYEACMQRASEQGVNRLVLLADLVGYNADSVAILDRTAMTKVVEESPCSVHIVGT